MFALIVVQEKERRYRLAPYLLFIQPQRTDKPHQSMKTKARVSAKLLRLGYIRLHEVIGERRVNLQRANGCYHVTLQSSLLDDVQRFSCPLLNDANRCFEKWAKMPI